MPATNPNGSRVSVRLGAATGAVVAFDAHQGFGTVRANDGAESFFHCTAIADGTRTIEVGTAVAYEVGPGRPGQWEATGLRIT